MKTLKVLLELITPNAKPEVDGVATRIRLALAAIAGTVVLGALYGFAIGATSLDVALQNIIKLPMILIVPLGFSWPVATLISKFLGTPLRGSDLLLSQGTALFGATMVLAVLAPIVALFYFTTPAWGGVVAMSSAGLAAIAGLVFFFRAVRERKKAKEGYFPAAIATFFYLLSAIQVSSLASPILLESTRLGDGVPGLF